VLRLHNKGLHPFYLVDMWHIATVLRERKSLLVAQAVKASRYTTRFQHNGGGATVAIQLDYYMSIQFAGVANALVNNKYSERGIDLTFLPTCPVGLEQERTRLHQNAYPKAISIGSVEQNIFVPTLAKHPGLKTTAVAAMFRKSPLCVASLQNLEVTAGEMMTIAAHEDTVELLQRIFPHCKVVASPRATKNSDLLTGKYDGIQAYTTTEVPTLRRQLGKDPAALALEGYKGTKLGYSQVLFAADECLADDRREVVQAFLEATFEGWGQAIRQDPALTVQAVKEAQWMLGLDDEHNDHWHRSSDFDLEMLQLINDHVKETYEGDRYGVIHPTRWSQANHWLLQGKPSVEANFGLDATVWQPPKQLLSGNELGRSLLEDAKASASAFRETYGRKPSLAVITVGDLVRYTDAKRRLQLYSNKCNSWFSKTATGAANGFDVKETQLDASATTDEVLSEIYAAKDCDGIQLMWPLPDHINATKVYNAIAAAKDVDGIHYVGQLEIGNEKAHPPVTAAGTLALMKRHGVNVKGKRVLVIGRSPIVGSPIAHMIRAEGGATTVAHTDVSTELLKQLVGEADVIVTCAGSPGLIQADWIKNAQVINVGSTFLNETDSLHSDVAGDISAHAARYSPVPGGIGPLSLPFLLQNTVRAAWSRMDSEGRVENTWGRTPATLTKTFHFKNYTAALYFAQKLDEMSTVMDHHANMTFSHRCVDGVDVTLEFFTFEASALTEKDCDAAKVADMVYCGNAVKMSDFTYDLKEESIAKYPATPRGSSKLLRVDGNGNVSYYSNFAESFGSLVKGAHVVFNESRVLEARLFVDTPSGKRAELMLLDLGEICATESCNETTLRAMIRVHDLSKGDVFKESSGGVDIEVTSVEG
jgi:methylenetetrahydrofolate dehydrogenase (NADP+) / methenyltetrahydrofolate cyclohydrolase